jgi:integrase
LERDRGTVRASPRPRPDVLDRLIATCATDSLADTRDLAIRLLAFASGGRRRSEVARLRVEQLRDEPPAWLDPRDAKSPALPCLAIQLGGTKTGDVDEEGRVLLVGPPGEALREWLERADIKKGPIFRAIDRWEAVEEKALRPQPINLIVKRRCAMAGLDRRRFRRMVCGQGILPRRRGKESGCRRRRSGRSTAGSSGRRATTMRPRAQGRAVPL